MNENIDLTKILKDCPENTKFYTSIYGEVSFKRIDKDSSGYPIKVDSDIVGHTTNLTRKGQFINTPEGECILFPSKDQRDWNKFTAPWYKKDKFDPSTLKPFDKVLAKVSGNDIWSVDFFSYYDNVERRCICTGLVGYYYCIPYNDETKDLVGTCNEAPDYYKWW